MQDITPPKNTQARGAIRPPVRLDVPQPATRVTQSRETFRFSRAIDGMSGIVRTTSQTTITTTVVEAPQPSATPQPSTSQPSAIAPSRPAQEVSFAQESLPQYQTDHPKHIEVTLANEVNETLGKKKFKRPAIRDGKRGVLIVAAVALLIITSYVSIDTWLTNSRAVDQAEAAGASGAAGATWTSEQEGQDETKVSSDALSKYVVAADLPRALYIDKLDVSARILPMSVNTAGNIQAPLNIYDAGWYNGSVKPGQTGAVFIDGHASGPTREGLFAYLDTMNTGDTLQVEKGDGTLLTYRVIFKEVVALNDIDMKKVLLPYGNTLKALNLMTCTGTWLPDKKTYDQRVVVYTEQV